ncbi:MAG: (2Fe-2S) ferredoxin domain-containing protein [Acholeplasmataceae bacterium]|nr:(2Fe-2S) ferredoxin domain-containing protein [Candidatus Izemoplasmatales bacterium]
MKSLEDLKKLRDQSLKNMTMRYQTNGTRVQIGMGTCGIAAGARPVMSKFLEEISNRNLNNVTVTQVGCMGECAFEPIVEIVEQNGNSTIYCLVSEKKVAEIVEEHIIGGKRLERYLLSGVKR